MKTVAAPALWQQWVTEWTEPCHDGLNVSHGYIRLIRSGRLGPLDNVPTKMLEALGHIEVALGKSKIIVDTIRSLSRSPILIETVVTGLERSLPMLRVVASGPMREVVVPGDQFPLALWLLVECLSTTYRQTTPYSGEVVLSVDVTPRTCKITITRPDEAADTRHPEGRLDERRIPRGFVAAAGELRRADVSVTFIGVTQPAITILEWQRIEVANA